MEKIINTNDVIKDLFSLQEKNLITFHENLIPGASEVIGIRTNNLRKYAKKMVNDYNKDEILLFIKTINPHQYQELDYLKSFLICYVKIDTSYRIKLLDEYSYEINNWATCDMAVDKPTFKKKDLTLLFEFTKQLLVYNKEYPYRNRFGLVFLMKYFNNTLYSCEIIEMIESLDYGYYYLDMAVAWLISVMLVYDYNNIIEYLKGKNNLNEFTYQKALQKAIESYRISDEQKSECRLLKKRGKIC